jgi:hypothetical protein
MVVFLIKSASAWYNYAVELLFKYILEDSVRQLMKIRSKEVES